MNGFNKNEFIAVDTKKYNFIDELIKELNTDRFTIMTTKECNLRCKYCYEKNKTARRMSIETAKDIVSQL